MLNPDYRERLSEAVAEYEMRQRREVHPLGHFNPNHTWYPNVEERRDCCYSLHGCSSAYPWTLNRHCRTTVHLAALFQVQVEDLRGQARIRRGDFGKAATVARRR